MDFVLNHELLNLQNTPFPLYFSFIIKVVHYLQYILLVQ